METGTISSKLYNLVGDIGATNARFALVSPGSSEMENIQSLKCTDFEDIQSAILFYLSDLTGIEIQAACFATAGTVHLDVFKLQITTGLSAKKMLKVPSKELMCSGSMTLQRKPLLRLRSKIVTLS